MSKTNLKKRENIGPLTGKRLRQFTHDDPVRPSLKPGEAASMAFEIIELRKQPKENLVVYWVDWRDVPFASLEKVHADIPLLFSKLNDRAKVDGVKVYRAEYDDLDTLLGVMRLVQDRVHTRSSTWEHLETWHVPVKPVLKAKEEQ